MKVKKALFVCWRDPVETTWLPVGVLICRRKKFMFGYTKGANEAKHFRGFGRMNDFKAIYTSDQLFPLFENRLLNQSRPEFRRFMEWLDLDPKDADPFNIFAKTSGLRFTDSLELVPVPMKGRDSKFKMEHFCRGIRFLSECSKQKVNTLKPGDKLYLMRDFQNNAHDQAIALRTDNPATMIGYAPRYVAEEICRLSEKKKLNNVEAFVVRVNVRAPSEFRLLCRIAFDWPKQFRPFASNEFVPINTSMRRVLKEIRAAS